MNILLVTPEIPQHGGGGIATYTANMTRALCDAGHSVNIFSWRTVTNEPTQKLISRNSFHVDINAGELWAKFNAGPETIAASHFLLDYILEAVAIWEPDLIEGTDYLAPLYAYQLAKRNGAISAGLSKPVAIFNHGLQRDIYRCDANIPTEWARQNIYTERLTLKWADICLVPSNFAHATMLRQCGNVSAYAIIPEPYYSVSKKKFSPGHQRFVSLGRTSISKGLDHSIHFLNVMDSIDPVETITFIGKVGHTPFKTTAADEYTIKRLSPALREKINITGHLSRDEVSKVLNTAASSGFSLNFSPQETFNYAFLELLDHGLLPYSKKSTAMEEFFPDHLRHLLIPHDFNLSQLSFIHESIKTNAEYGEEVRDYAGSKTNPSNFAQKYEEAVAPLLDKKPFISPTKVTSRATAEDVTFLMASFNPKGLITESINSVRAQSTKGASLIIVSDGSTDAQSLALLDEVSKVDGVRIIHSEANEGLCATRTKLISECGTNLAVFIDDDDIINYKYLEKTIEVYNQNTVNANAVLTWRRNFGINESLIINFNMEDYEFLLWNDFRMTSLIETSALRTVGFVPGMRNGEADDWDFWLRFREMGYLATILPEDLFRYRYHEGSMSWPWSKGQAELTAEIQSRSILTGLKLGRLPDDVVLELITSARLNEMSDKSVALGQAEIAAIKRWGFIQAAKQKRPIIGRMSEILYKGGSWLARNSTGQRVS